MLPLDRIPGLQPELSALLAELGVEDLAALAAADPQVLAQGLETLGRKRGRISLVPGLSAVRLFVKIAQERMHQAASVNYDDIPEAEVDHTEDDIPEAIIEPPPAAPVGAPMPRPAAEAFTNAAKPAVDATWQGVERTRFQTLDDYTEGGRGIQPLKRTENSRETGGGPAKLSKGSTLSRWTRRGVLYPWPLRAISGALIAVLWRVGLAFTCIALPIYLFFTGDNEVRPISETITWVGIVFTLGFLEVWFISRTRCRVCSCHLFFSKRCFKNSRAHLIPGLGYVLSLSLHLLIFAWFRCMYCGTAIRLFGPSSRQGEPRD